MKDLYSYPAEIGRYDPRVHIFLNTVGIREEIFLTQAQGRRLSKFSLRNLGKISNPGTWTFLMHGYFLASEFLRYFFSLGYVVTNVIDTIVSHWNTNWVCELGGYAL